MTINESFWDENNQEIDNTDDGLSQDNVFPRHSKFIIRRKYFLSYADQPKFVVRNRKFQKFVEHVYDVLEYILDKPYIKYEKPVIKIFSDGISKIPLEVLQCGDYQVITNTSMSTSVEVYIPFDAYDIEDLTWLANMVSKLYSQNLFKAKSYMLDLHPYVDFWKNTRIEDAVTETQNSALWSFSVLGNVDQAIFEVCRSIDDEFLYKNILYGPSYGKTEGCLSKKFMDCHSKNSICVDIIETVEKKTTVDELLDYADACYGYAMWSDFDSNYFDMGKGHFAGVSPFTEDKFDVLIEYGNDRDGKTASVDFCPYGTVLVPAVDQRNVHFNYELFPVFKTSRTKELGTAYNNVFGNKLTKDGFVKKLKKIPDNDKKLIEMMCGSLENLYDMIYDKFH